MCVHGVKSERERRGWSQARLAELVGTDAGTVSRWERGVTSPSPHFREKLCALFGKDARELGLLAGGDEGPDAADHPTRAPGGSAAAEPSAVGAGSETQDAGPGSTASTDRRPAEVPTTGSRALACAAYALGWLSGLLVALFARSDRFALFHGLQAICFFGAAHAIIAASALTAPSVEQAAVRATLSVVGPLIAVVALITWAVAIVQAARGRYYQVPVVGGLCRSLAETLAPRASLGR